MYEKKYSFSNYKNLVSIFFSIRLSFLKKKNVLSNNKQKINSGMYKSSQSMREYILLLKKKKIVVSSKKKKIINFFFKWKLQYCRRLVCNQKRYTMWDSGRVINFYQYHSFRPESHLIFFTSNQI